MPTAIWNGAVVAESDETVIVEGNHYFPPASLTAEYFVPNDRTTVCPWKGVASYYDLQVDGEVNQAAAWTYPTPKDAAAAIKDHVAFYGSVTITE